MSQQTIICPRCKTENRADANFCRNCSAPLKADQFSVGSTTIQLSPRAEAKTRQLPPQTPTYPLPPAQAKPRGSGDGETVRLAWPVALYDMPVGAIINGGYEVVETIGQPEPNINVYQVREVATGQVWTLFEAADPKRFEREGQFAKRNLNHEGLVKVRDAFEWVPYADQPRGYLVSEYPQRPLTGISQLSDYQIAVWGAQFADTLAFLHSQKMSLGGVTLSNLVTVNGRAKLTDLGESLQLSQTVSPETAMAQDIHDLVNVLAALAGQLRPGTSLAAPLIQIVQRELASPNHYQSGTELQADFQAAAETLRSAGQARLVFDHGWNVGQKREVNEDSFYAQELSQYSNALGRPVGLFLVADGLGGAAAGEVASKLAVDTIAREVTLALSAYPLSTSSEMDWGALIKRAIENSNRAINAARQQAHNDMGTTVVGALVVGYEAYVVNVGDSRAYFIARDRPIERISHDHSLVQSLVDSHQIRDEDVRTHPQRNLIFRNLGDRTNVEVDLFPRTLEPGQWLVFCSDGLWEMVQDADIQRIVTTLPTLKQACDTLVELANRNGGDDNITVVVVQIDAG